jgi:hypoxanthine phosphoribosyltransferase
MKSTGRNERLPARSGGQETGIFEGSVRARVPARWRSEISRVLIPESLLKKRVAELGREISRDLGGDDLVVVPFLTGTVVFLADLIRQFDFPLRLDFMGFSSYRGATRGGRLVMTKPLNMPIRGRTVLVVDDILDTGRTLSRGLALLRRQKPRAIKVCVLLSKDRRREVAIDADYIGFRIPDEFVVGYGLDYAERFRNLRFLGILKQGKNGV